MTKRTGILLRYTDDLAERLRQAAKKQGVSLNQFIINQLEFATSHPEARENLNPLSQTVITTTTVPLESDIARHQESVQPEEATSGYVFHSRDAHYKPNRDTCQYPDGAQPDDANGVHEAGFGKLTPDQSNAIFNAALKNRLDLSKFGLTRDQFCAWLDGKEQIDSAIARRILEEIGVEA